MPFAVRQIPEEGEFRRAAERGAVIRRVDEEGYSLYVYSRQTFYAGLTEGWDQVCREARGIVFDPAGKLVCLPFPKFFNVGENAETQVHTLPKEPVRVTEKLDGSLIAVWHDGNRWRTSTKGAFESAQAVWARGLIERTGGWDRFDGLERITVLFEGIAPRGTFEDEFVIDYGDREELVLLAAYDTSARTEVTPSGVDEIARRTGFSRPDLHSFASVEEALDRAATLGLESEGYVLQFMESGLRVKVKGEKYRLAVKALNGATLLGFWGAMNENGRVSRAVIEVIPVELRDDLMPDLHSLEDLYARLREHVRRLASAAVVLPEGRERADWIQENAGPLAGAVFAAIAGNASRVHGAIHRLIKPTGNKPSEQASKLLQRLET